MQVTEGGSATVRSRADLALAGHRLGIDSDDPGLLADALSVMVPPFRSEPPSDNRGRGWTVDIHLGDGCAVPEMAAGLPVLTWPGSGRTLTVLKSGGAAIDVAGTYANGAGTS
jgi:hypothetical protein